MARPETIENRWDVLYRDYPEAYDEWARIPKRPTAVQAVDRHSSLLGLHVVDVGAGSGLSTFELAQYAAFVTGVEPEDGMLAIARESQRRQGVTNVRFLSGSAESLPLESGVADAAVAITLASAEVAAAAAEMERVTRQGGLVTRVDIAPGWYGGELDPVIYGRPRDEAAPAGSRDDVLAKLGYAALDFFMDQDYGSVDEAVRTYGFIFGRRAIDHIREHRISAIRWKARIRYKWL